MSIDTVHPMSIYIVHPASIDTVHPASIDTVHPASINNFHRDTVHQNIVYRDTVHRSIVHHGTIHPMTDTTCVETNNIEVLILKVNENEMLRDEEGRPRNITGQLINVEGAVIPDVIDVAKTNDFDLNR